MIATFLTFPMVVLRTHSHLDKNEDKKNYWNVVKKLCEKHGFSGLFVGKYIFKLIRI